MRLRDELETIFVDETFAALFPRRGQPAQSPWRLALVTVFQFAEGLSDREAADAVRSRIDWKYALSLELTDPGFDHSVLSEFRSRLLTGHAEHLLLDTFLERLREHGLLRARGRQRTDSTHVLAVIRALNRVELVAETLRAALNSLAVAAPEWLLAHAEPEWATRYALRAAADRRLTKPEQRQQQAEVTGTDGFTLLTRLYAPDTPRWLCEVPAVERLRQVWVQNFVPTEPTAAGGSGGGRWRTEEDGLPPSLLFIASPYDTDARYARKYTTSWVGYKVHLSETCEDDSPHLITHVATTSGPTADGTATPLIHQALQDKDLLPAIHLVDTGYLDAELLATSQREYGVDLLGPTRRDVKHKQPGFAAQAFPIDWEQKQATCPEGHTSVSWTPAVDNRNTPVIKIKFSMQDCRPCPSRGSCILSRSRYPRRTITVRPKDHFLALQARRAREQTPEYAREVVRRAGIEATISQGVRVLRLRRSRYAGLARTHLSHVLTAAGLNFLRVTDWLAGIPLAGTRTSPFTDLMAGLTGS
jgi:transposase